MLYELISAEEYEGLPEEPDMRFVELEQICRRNMNELVREDDRGEYTDLIQMQYMMTVSAAAEELGIAGLDYPHEADRPALAVNGFLLQASGVVTRIRLRASSKNRAASVRLSARSRALIEIQIRRLRAVVETADMDEGRRSHILKKLNELSEEIANPRVSFAKAMAAIVVVAAGVTAPTTSFLADAPEAIATITSILGADKLAEEAEIERLGPPPKPKALPAPPLSPRVPSTSAPTFLKPGDDDDIPF